MSEENRTRTGQRRRKPRESAKEQAATPPAFTEEVAYNMARLLCAGCPPEQAALYLCPDCDDATVKATAREWMASRELLIAVEELEGGAWLDLPAEKRYQLAYDKQVSEMAFYLRTHNFVDVTDKVELEKMKMARETLRAEIKGVGAAEDPNTAFARFAMELLKVRQAETSAAQPVAPPLQRFKDMSVMITGDKES